LMLMLVVCSMDQGEQGLGTVDLKINQGNWNLDLNFFERKSEFLWVWLWNDSCSITGALRLCKCEALSTYL
jgi:hypothetical protein